MTIGASNLGEVIPIFQNGLHLGRRDSRPVVVGKWIDDRGRGGIRAPEHQLRP